MYTFKVKRLTMHDLTVVVVLIFRQEIRDIQQCVHRLRTSQFTDLILCAAHISFFSILNIKGVSILPRSLEVFVHNAILAFLIFLYKIDIERYQKVLAKY